MKFISKLFCLFAMLGTFASCDKDYELPPLSEPTFTLPSNAKTTTIAELRQTFKAATQDKPIVISDSLWLKARVSANDAAKNIYKQIMLQDNTGGISFLVDQSGVYNDYPVGQEVFVSLKGLCVSVYGDQYQLGSTAGNLFRAPYEIFKEHVNKKGWANPKDVQIFDTKSFKEAEDNAACLFNVVRFEGVHFQDGGKMTFAQAGDPGNGSNRTLVDESGATIVVRTSTYADFANDQLPVGKGTVVGVLTKFRDTWQLTIPSPADFYGFDGKPIEGGGTEGGGEVKPDQPAGFPFIADFSKNEQGFTIEKGTLAPELSFVWKYFVHATYGNCWKASGTKKVGDEYKHFASDSKVVSPEIDLTSVKVASMAVEQAGNHFDSQDNFKKYVSVGVKVAGTDKWETLAADKYPTGTSYDYVVSKFDLAKYVGKKVQVALIYTSDDKCAGTWQVKKLEITGEAAPKPTPDPTPNPDGGGDGGGEVKPQPTDVFYNQDFATSEAVKKDGKYWPAFMKYVDKLNTSGKFAVSNEKYVSIRSTKDFGNNIWFGKGYENWIEFQDIDVKGASEVTITAKIAANLYNAGETNDLSALEIEVEGKTYKFPATPVKDKNQTPQELSVKVPANGGKITFRVKSNKELNTTGLRLYGVKVAKA